MGMMPPNADDDGMEVVQPTEEELEEARRVEALLQHSSGAHREAKIAGIRPTEKVKQSTVHVRLCLIVTYVRVVCIEQLSARPEPVSIEELAKQRQTQENAKPKFLSKEG
jgi:hypothetical protein